MNSFELKGTSNYVVENEEEHAQSGSACVNDEPIGSNSDWNDAETCTIGATQSEDAEDLLTIHNIPSQRKLLDKIYVLKPSTTTIDPFKLKADQDEERNIPHVIVDSTHKIVLKPPMFKLLGRSNQQLPLLEVKNISSRADLLTSIGFSTMDMPEVLTSNEKYPISQLNDNQKHLVGEQNCISESETMYCTGLSSKEVPKSKSKKEKKKVTKKVKPMTHDESILHIAKQVQELINKKSSEDYQPLVSEKQSMQGTELSSKKHEKKSKHTTSQLGNNQQPPQKEGQPVTLLQMTKIPSQKELFDINVSNAKGVTESSKNHAISSQSCSNQQPLEESAQSDSVGVNEIPIDKNSDNSTGAKYKSKFSFDSNVYTINKEMDKLYILKKKVNKYLDKILNIIERNKKFFTKKGRLDGFTLDLTKYKCHMCNKVLQPSKKETRIFTDKIFTHILECREKRPNQNNNEDVAKETTTDFQFADIHNTIVGSTKLLKDSFEFLKVTDNTCECLVCKMFIWKDTESITVKTNQIYKVVQKLMLHLQDHHFVISKFWNIEKVHTNHENMSSVLKSTYLIFANEINNIKAFKSLWISDESNNTLACKLCKSTYRFFHDISSFKDVVLSHSNFHRACLMNAESLPSPSSREISATFEETENSSLLLKMFISLGEYYSILLATADFWVIDNEGNRHSFICKWCKCSVILKTPGLNEVRQFLIYHLKIKEHSDSVTNFKKAKNNPVIPKKCPKDQPDNSKHRFYQIYTTLDMNDELINLSIKDFHEFHTGNYYRCNGCNSLIESGGNNFEFRYLLWIHINSEIHKARFPHIKKNLNKLKSDLSEVLSPDVRVNLDSVKIGPVSNFVECTFCQGAVPMRFYALKRHIEEDFNRRKKIVGKIKMKTLEKVEERNERMFIDLKNETPEFMKTDLKFIKKGLMPGYVTCALCACAFSSSVYQLELHLAGTEHIKNRGGVWYD